MGVAELQKMSPPTTGRCYQTREWGQPTNGSAARRHGSQSLHFSFFGVVDQTITQYFWSTGWEVISKFPSHSSLVWAVAVGCYAVMAAGHPLAEGGTVTSTATIDLLSTLCSRQQPVQPQPVHQQPNISTTDTRAEIGAGAVSCTS